MQDDVRYYGAMIFQELADASAWQTLLSLHADARFRLDILDGGAYTVIIPSADLRADTYDRAVCTIDSG